MNIIGNFTIVRTAPDTTFRMRATSTPATGRRVGISRVGIVDGSNRIVIAGTSNGVVALSGVLKRVVNIHETGSRCFSVPTASNVMLMAIRNSTACGIVMGWKQ